MTARRDGDHYVINGRNPGSRTAPMARVGVLVQDGSEREPRHKA